MRSGEVEGTGNLRPSEAVFVIEFKDGGRANARANKMLFFREI